MSNFSQKILIIVAAISISCCSVWYLQRGWLSQDPHKIQVDPQVREQVLTLLKQAKTVDYQRRVAIFYRIRDIGRESVPVLVQALDDQDAEIRAFAANLLQYSQNLSVVPHLEAKLSDQDATVRKTALSALGTLGAVETVPAIILVLNDQDNFTRCQAAQVLGVLKDDDAVVPLIHLLQEDTYAVARQTAANSLGEIGDEAAVAPLIVSLEDNDTMVRSASMVALNRITGERLGPQKEAWIRWLNEK